MLPEQRLEGHAKSEATAMAQIVSSEELHFTFREAVSQHKFRLSVVTDRTLPGCLSHVRSTII